MRADGTFTVKSFTPATVAPEPDPAVRTGLPVGVAVLEKAFEGGLTGRSTTLFTSAYDQGAGAGTYLALESFEGAVGDREGTFNFVHSLSTTGGNEPSAAFFAIVPSSGTDGLAGISGGGGIAVDPDGTHRIRLDYELG